MSKKQKHLAIFKQPYLDLILAGTKTIESRFSQKRIAPFGKINIGDIVIMKVSGGLVLGEFEVSKVMSFSNLNNQKWNEIKKYSKEICSDQDSDFWKKRLNAKYATLIGIQNVVRYKKARQCTEKKSNDRRAWIVLIEKKI